MNSMPKIVAICGPTGVGKTEVSLKVAERFKAEIINFDSQQFYKELVIGTAKPIFEERRGIPHHLFEALTLKEDMSAGKFVEIADKLVWEIHSRGKLPLLVGGTGLYLRAFEYGIFKVDVDPLLREKLRRRAEENLEELFDALKRLDPEYAQRIHPRDRVRITRALEVIFTTGKSFSFFHQKNPFFKSKRYPLLKIGLNLSREELYARINERVLKMVEKGWLREVEDLLKNHGQEVFAKIKAIGYDILLKVHFGEMSMDTAITIIQQETRRYAKRQLTWFKKEKDIEWFKPQEIDRIIGRIEAFLKGA